MARYGSRCPNAAVTTTRARPSCWRWALETWHRGLRVDASSSLRVRFPGCGWCEIALSTSRRQPSCAMASNDPPTACSVSQQRAGIRDTSPPAPGAVDDADSRTGHPEAAEADTIVARKDAKTGCADAGVRAPAGSCSSSFTEPGLGFVRQGDSSHGCAPVRPEPLTPLILWSWSVRTGICRVGDCRVG